MGYYPSYRSLTDPSAVRFDRFSHIIGSFISVDADGKAVVPPAIVQPSLIEAAHKQGVKVLLALGGGGNGANFGQMVRNPRQRARFIQDIVRIMTEHDADGLAVDWEVPEASDKAVTVEFISKLRRQMKIARPHSLLVLVVNSSPGNSQGYDGPRLRDQVDFLHVMSYDFHGPWNGAGHHTSLYASQADALDHPEYSYPAILSYWRDVQGFRPGQILFGIAGYGRGFKARQWGEKSAEPSQYPEISFTDARALIGHGWTRQWDAQAHAPWLLKDDGSERISYDDPQSVADKARWMKANGLPGFFIWELTQEQSDGDNLLTAAASKAWNDAPTGRAVTRANDVFPKVESNHDLAIAGKHPKKRKPHCQKAETSFLQGNLRQWRKPDQGLHFSRGSRPKFQRRRDGEMVAWILPVELKINHARVLRRDGAARQNPIYVRALDRRFITMKRSEGSATRACREPRIGKTGVHEGVVSATLARGRVEVAR